MTGSRVSEMPQRDTSSKDDPPEHWRGEDGGGDIKKIPALGSLFDAVDATQPHVLRRLNLKLNTALTVLQVFRNSR